MIRHLDKRELNTLNHLFLTENFLNDLDVSSGDDKIENEIQNKLIAMERKIKDYSSAYNLCPSFDTISKLFSMVVMYTKIRILHGDSWKVEVPVMNKNFRYYHPFKLLLKNSKTHSAKDELSSILELTIDFKDEKNFLVYFDESPDALYMVGEVGKENAELYQLNNDTMRKIKPMFDLKIYEQVILEFKEHLNDERKYRELRQSMEKLKELALKNFVGGLFQ